MFGRRLRRPGGARIPVVALTGFLGAGKTTLLRALLATPEGADSALVVNEYGEVGIDQALLRDSTDTIALLGNGCLCCRVRSDLQETLRTLLADRLLGRVPSFRRVIVETSGLADPGPLLQTFLTDRAIGGEYHLRALVAVVDAATFADTAARAPEARRQVALADRVVLTKTDLADAAGAEAAVRALNPAAPMRAAVAGRIDPAFLLDEAPPRTDRGGTVPVAHSEGLETFSLVLDRPMRWEVFAQAMATLTALRGPDLLRVKGLVAVEGCAGPVVVHVVQHLAHPPEELERWPDDDRRTRLVFVTRAIPRARVEAVFAAIEAAAG